MPEPASRIRRRSVASSKTSMQGVLQPWPIDDEVAYGTEPRTPKNRTRMSVEAYYGAAAAARRRAVLRRVANPRDDFIRPHTFGMVVHVRDDHQFVGAGGVNQPV